MKRRSYSMCVHQNSSNLLVLYFISQIYAYLVSRDSLTHPTHRSMVSTLIDVQVLSMLMKDATQDACRRKLDQLANFFEYKPRLLDARIVQEYQQQHPASSSPSPVSTAIAQASTPVHTPRHAATTPIRTPPQPVLDTPTPQRDRATSS